MARSGQSVTVIGLAELQRAFKTVDRGLARATRQALRGIAEPIQTKARGNVQHNTGRHGVGGLPGSIRISVTQKSVSVYSNKPHAAVQDTGGRVGKGAIITRGSASKYMTEAYIDSKPQTTQALQELSDRIANEYERG